jgi:hypothetical protein
MTWLTWRQYRAQFGVGTVVLAALCLLLLLTGLQFFSNYHTIITECAAGGGHNNGTCSTGGGLFSGGPTAGFVSLILLAAPVLAGLFLGAPVAAEFESGTNQFAWVQGITRWRWLAVKAGWLLLAAAAWGGILAALTTWWAGPTNAEHGSEFYPGRFDVLYLVPVAYAVFAMALGICAGALIRRTVPAMAVTLGGFIAVRLAVLFWLRPHYLSAVTTTRSLLNGVHLTGSYWLIHQGVLNPAGQVIQNSQNQAAFNGIAVSSLPSVCSGLANTQAGAPVMTASCRAALTGYRSFVTYQPADRFWTFQGIETCIFLALAAIALTVTAIVLIRRDA